MLSIIIPTLNEEDYLPLLLKSIKAQNFKDYEIIVADAGSEDKTQEIAKNYGCKVVKGGLPAKGRNKGAKIARGDLFLFIDADSELDPHFLSRLIKEFEKRKLDIAAFPVYPVRNIVSKGVYPQEKRIEINIIDKIAYGIYNFWARLTQRFLHHTTQTVLVKREVHEKIKGFDEEVTIGEDFVYARAGAKIGKFGFLENLSPVLTSDRRFERDGRIKIYSKYLLCGIYMAFFGGVKSDIFNYRLPHYLKQKKNKKQ